MPESDLIQRQRDSLNAAPITSTGFPSSVADVLPAAAQRIAEALQPQKIILFGSYAYGTPTPDSDVDLLVIMETTAPHVERYLAVCRLLRPRPFPVDILVRTPAEIECAVQSGDFFIKEILSRGRVLYERN
jgi:predicted nucleotidyltransferase